MTAAVRIPPAEPFPVHQHRTVVAAVPALATAAARMSREYVGGVLVSVPSGEHSRDAVARFVAAGCGPDRVTFYSAAGQPDVERVRGLLHAYAPQVPRAATGFWSVLAETIAVGATHVLGFDTDTLVAARVVALRINCAFGSAELPLPVPLAVPSPAVADGGWPDHELVADPSSVDADRLVAAGNRWLAPEWEQRADLLEEMLPEGMLPDGMLPDGMLEVS